MTALAYFLIGMVVGCFMAYAAGDGLESEPVAAGLMGLVAWPLVLLIVVVALPFLPLLWLFGKLGEAGGER